MTAAADATLVPVPAPVRPWKRTGQTVTRTGAIAVLSVAVSVSLNAATDLDGILGLYLGLAIALPALTLLEAVRHGRNLAVDRFAASLVSVAFAAVIIPWVSIVQTVWTNGSKAFHSRYLTDDMRITPSSDALNLGGVRHAVIGTLLMVLVATAIAVPLGILSAVYIVEIKGRLAGLVRFLTQAMSGVPSIVAGLFIYSTVVIFFKGFSATAGALAYVILMLPTVSRTAEEVLKLVPDDLRSASYALGASQARTTFRVVLPTIASGLVTSAILGVARVAGETAPLILTASYFVATSVDLGAPIASLPIYIFQNIGLGDANATTRAWGGALVLLGLILVLFVLARTVSARLTRKRKP
ncbi:MAG: phosphate ABC transporter permease PstA [Actinomycetota bacterium]